ncbi:MAG: hypothetical protein HY907_01675 [Deltaproteobacteria bacterium]|nr:hypothetical protein [Deltaproteobacteria bacterium]
MRLAAAVCALAVAGPAAAQVRTADAWVPVAVEPPAGAAPEAASTETTMRGIDAVTAVFGPAVSVAAPRVRRCGADEGAVTAAVVAASFVRAQERYYRGEFGAVRDEIVTWMDVLQSGCRPLSVAADAWTDPGPVGALHAAGALLLLSADEVDAVGEAEQRLRRVLATFPGSRPTDGMFPPSLADRYLDVEPDETEVGRITVEAPGCEVNVAGRVADGPVRALAGNVPLGIRCDGEAFVMTVPVAAGSSLRIVVPSAAGTVAPTTTERTLARIAAAVSSLAVDRVAVAFEASGATLRVAVWASPAAAGVWSGDVWDDGLAGWLAALRDAAAVDPGAGEGADSDGGLWGAAALLAAGAVLGGGGAWALADAQQRRELSYDAVTAGESRRLADAAGTLDATGWALVGVGAAAVAAGVVWLAIELAGGGDERPDERGAAVLPLLGPASAGLRISF